MYAGDYPTDLIEVWAEHIKKWAKKTKNVFCYFNNDVKGFAVHNAMRLQEIITHKAVAVG
jgi:uncharacterized protein YecE (DUF72 family)